jgi:hypothetical protein
MIVGVVLSRPGRPGRPGCPGRPGRPMYPSQPQSRLVRSTLVRVLRTILTLSLQESFNHVVLTLVVHSSEHCCSLRVRR